jgi:uncharacterized membrane protein YgcG
VAAAPPVAAVAVVADQGGSGRRWGMRAVLFILALFAAVASDAIAAERITSFTSDVAIGADSSLTVKETIALVSEGSEIKRGINRDFPTIYKDNRGLRYVVGFEVLGVTRDGHDEPYAVLSIDNGKRIRIGSADVFLDNGPHVYEITYRTTRQLGYFEGFDELYWNVTGNSWTFPIERAEAIIQLPPGAAIKQHAEYTGRQGESGHDAEVTQSSGDRYQARTTRTLAPYEGFTVAVGWPKGVVTPPTEIEKAEDAVKDNVGLFTILGGVLLSFLYYFFAWLRVGRDPPKGNIIPLFSPPSGLGPAGTRYVWKQKFDEKAFAASLVGLAVKGRARIVENNGHFSIDRKEDASQSLTRAETALYQAMPRGMTELEKVNHAKVGAMKSALEETLEKEHQGVSFLRNLKWLWGGVVLSVVAMVTGAFLLPSEDAAMGILLSVWSGVFLSIFLTVGWALVKGLLSTTSFWGRLGSIFSLAFLAPFFIGGALVPTILVFGMGTAGLYVFTAGSVLLIIMAFVFHKLLRAPTVSGRKLLDQIEGFRMYMTTAEEERLKVLHPPEKTPELFERYLPYALALDCENEWNAKFAAVLAAAGAAAAAGVAASPTWYSGQSWDPSNTGSFTESIGSSLATSTSSASVPPGTSSGSGGSYSSGGGFSSGGSGGSSGGGGGGGGGSGW